MTKVLSEHKLIPNCLLESLLKGGFYNRGGRRFQEHQDGLATASSMSQALGWGSEGPVEAVQPTAGQSRLLLHYRELEKVNTDPGDAVA